MDNKVNINRTCIFVKTLNEMDLLNRHKFLTKNLGDEDVCAIEWITKNEEPVSKGFVHTTFTIDLPDVQVTCSKRYNKYTFGFGAHMSYIYDDAEEMKERKLSVTDHK